MISTRNDYVDYVVELMADWTKVSTRKMFGGYGLYREGLMFGLIADDQLYLKTDTDNEPQFKNTGCLPFVYTSKERTVQMSYWTAPDTSLESPAEMCDWCQSAYGAALRAQARKTGKIEKRKRL